MQPKLSIRHDQGEYWRQSETKKKYRQIKYMLTGWFEKSRSIIPDQINYMLGKSEENS